MGEFGVSGKHQTADAERRTYCGGSGADQCKFADACRRLEDMLAIRPPGYEICRCERFERVAKGDGSGCEGRSGGQVVDDEGRGENRWGKAVAPQQHHRDGKSGRRPDRGGAGVDRGELEAEIGDDEIGQRNEDKFRGFTCGKPCPGGCGLHVFGSALNEHELSPGFSRKRGQSALVAEYDLAATKQIRMSLNYSGVLAGLLARARGSPRSI